MMPFVPWTPAAATLAATGTAAWLRALAQGDRRALEALYRQEAPAVYRYMLALAGDAASAADATQDAFVALAENPAGFDAGRGTLGAYLAGVARHALLAHWRRRGREAPLDEEADQAVDEAACPEQRLVRQQDLERVWAALRALPWTQREAVVLVDLQGRPYVEAARIAGCELNTLRTRVLRGRLKLADALAAGDLP
jgi:RNA polymerase sigma factor (sigma-70 family)